MFRKLTASLFVLLVLAAASVAVLAQCDMITIPWQAVEELVTSRENLCMWLCIAAGTLVFVVMAIVLSSHGFRRKHKDTELDAKVAAETEEEETEEAEDEPEPDSPEDTEPSEEPGSPEEPEEAWEEPEGTVPVQQRGFSARRLKKIALIILVSLVALIAGLRFIAEPLMKRRMLGMISRRLKTPVTVGRSKSSIICGWAEAQDVVVAAPPDYREPITGRVGHVEVKLSPISILFGTVKIHQMELWDLDLRIEIQNHGVNLETLFYNWLAAGAHIKNAPLPPPVEIKKLIFHNAKVSVVDTDRARLVFDKAEIEADDLTLFLGLPYAVKVKSDSTFEGGKGKGQLQVVGTVGPMRRAINLDLALEGQQIDVRDMKVYIGDVAPIIGGHITSVDGKFVCRKDILDGTNLVIKSSSGEIYAIELKGKISEPVMSGSSKLVNALLVPLQKFLWLIRKIFRVDKHSDRNPDRNRDGRRSRDR